MHLSLPILRILAAGAMLWAPVASAYLTPEEVLLNEALYLPPRTGNEAQARITRQQEESRVRRDAEQELIFAAQRPPEPPAQEEPMHASAPEGTEDLSAYELELIRTIRLLNRVDEQQQMLHAGAPYRPLAPTGAGAVVTAAAMLGAVVWTLKKAGRRG